MVDAQSFGRVAAIHGHPIVPHRALEVRASDVEHLKRRTPLLRVTLEIDLWLRVEGAGWVGVLDRGRHGPVDADAGSGATLYHRRW